MRGGIMRDLNNLRAEERLFFDKYFWAVDSRSEYGNNRASSHITVRPFLHRTKNFYWEKAYLEYLKHQTIQDKAAIAAEITMDVAYTVGNAFNVVAPAINQVAQTIPIVGISWNLIDMGGSFVLAARDGKKHDGWSQGMNILSGLQLATGTVAFTLLNYSETLHIGISKSAGVSAIGAGASGFAFAAAMYFAWALEHREVKLHLARINHLDNKILGLEKQLFYTAFDENGKINKNADGELIFYRNNKIYGVDEYPGLVQETSDEKLDKCGIQNAEEKIKYLESLIEKVPKGGSALKEYEDLLVLLKFSQHQRQQLAIHEHARRAWSLCAVFMTAVAIVSAAVTALGLSAFTCGIALALASCAALLGSALYRHKPAIVEAAKIIKNNRNSFFSKPQPISRHSDEILFLGLTRC